MKGHVVDGVTGAAVARARVRLQGNLGGSPSLVLTDASGAFEFGRLPAGMYMLFAEKPGYQPARHPDPGRSLRAMRQTMLTLGDRQIIEDIALTIFRSGAIAGRVLDVHGDPVESADVRVMSAQKEAGRPNERGGDTNDLGEFRVSRLEPGRYLVAVVPRRIFLEHSVSSQDSPPLPQPLPTYYPSALSPDQAQPITIGKGQTVAGLEIVLAEGTPTVVSGVVVNREGQPVAGGGIAVSSAATDPFRGLGMMGTGLRPDGTFRLQLAPGEYVLTAHVPLRGNSPRQPERERAFGAARVSVGGEAIEGLTILVGHGAIASGRVVFEGSTPPPSPPEPLRLRLHSQDAACSPAEATVAADWSFRVEGLFGTCDQPMQTTFGRWTLKAVLHQGQNLLDRKMTFEQDQRFTDVQVIFTDRGTDLRFRVAGEDGQPTRDYVALIYPADKGRWSQADRYLRTYVPPSAEMTMMMNQRVATSAAPRLPSEASRESVMGLPPGDYYVVAIDDIEAERARDPAVLERLISSAKRVTLTSDAPASVALQRVKLADVVR